MQMGNFVCGQILRQRIRTRTLIFYRSVCMDTLMKCSSFGDKILKIVNFRVEKHGNLGKMLFVD